MIEAVDLFCGAGGLTAGLKKAGIQVRAGYDLDGACQHAFEFNNGAAFVRKDVADVSADEVNAWFQSDSVRLLAGCAPCQPFSSYNNGKDTSQDRKWPLMYQFSRLIKETEPDLITMENVPDVTKHQVYHDFVSELIALGYHTWADTVACIKYGLPQNRKRHVLLASKLGEISLIAPTHATPTKVRDVIGNLPAISAGEKHPNDPLHKSQSLSELNLMRIRASKAGGNWKDWPENLVADCHKKDSGKTYPSVYGRMKWDEPSPTMTTLCYGFGNGRFGHPEQDRAISLREAALLQSFPVNYQFAKIGSGMPFKSIGRMIGNAVPVRLGEVIGMSLINHLKLVNRHL